jgi:hypothetical protein
MMKQLFLALVFCLMLPVAVTPATYNAPARQMATTEQEIENYIIQKSLSVDFVKPGFPVGVIQVESRSKNGKQIYRTGKHGLYFLPGGIHEDFLKKWNLHNWKVCCDVAIETLYKRMIKKKCNEKAVLKSYNTTGYTFAYHNEIRKIKEQFNN